MGSITAAGMIAEIRAILGAINTDLVSDTVVGQHMNAGYQIDVSLKLDLPELDGTDTEATVASTATTAFSVTDVLTIKGIVDNNGIPLKQITANEYDRLLARTGAITGVPTHWYRTGSTTSGQVTVRWYPVPNAAYTMTLNYKKRPAAISSTTPTAIDSLYDEPIVYYGAARTAAYLRMYEDSQNLKKYADALLAGLGGLYPPGSEYQWSFTSNIMDEMA